MSKARRSTPEEDDYSQSIADKLVAVIHDASAEGGALGYNIIMSALLRATSFYIAGIESEAGRKEILEDFHFNLIDQVKFDRKHGQYAKTQRKI